MIGRGIMLGRNLVSAVRKDPEIMPLLIVCSLAPSFGIYSLGHFILSNPDVSPNHRETNWEKTERKQGRSPDRVLAIHLQDKSDASA